VCVRARVRACVRARAPNKDYFKILILIITFNIN